jgi:hypothetical protein
MNFVAFPGKGGEAEKAVYALARTHGPESLLTSLKEATKAVSAGQRKTRNQCKGSTEPV